MRSNRLWLVAMAVALTVAPASAIAQATSRDTWIGQRVFTRFGTVLKVGGQIADDERISENLAASGQHRREVRVYRVEQTNGSWLWLKYEKKGISGWVQSANVIPYDQAIDYYTSQLRSNPTAMAYEGRGAVWQLTGEHDIAICDFNEAIRLDPKSDTAYFDRGLAWKSKRAYEKAIADFNEAIRLEPKYAGPYNNRAWLWATCPDAKFRDGKRAVESALRANELTSGKNAYYVGTLAASYAEAGDFVKAVEYQQKANKLDSDDDAKKRGEDRLKLYKEKKPYREQANQDSDLTDIAINYATHGSETPCPAPRSTPPP